MLNKIKKTEIPSIPNEKLCKYNGIIVFKPILPIQRNWYDPFILSKKTKKLKDNKKTTTEVNRVYFWSFFVYFSYLQKIAVINKLTNNNNIINKKTLFR